MSYRLDKPYTVEEKDNFIFKYNQDCFHEGYHCRIEETNKALFALEDNEIMVNDEPAIDPDYERRKQQEEEERVANLKMTALDFIGVLKQFGLTSQQIREYLDTHINLDEQLKYCQNVYCGVVQALCPLELYGISITKEMVIHAFKVKNGEE